MTARDYASAISGATILIAIACFVMVAATLLGFASLIQWAFAWPSRVFR